ncbi:MAG: sulfotransferase [Chthonomonadales bacterium]|nr:sulfotransferase [Chthonomonadales bacterium]
MAPARPPALDVRCPPLILIGMHRSGTTMVASMLAELGLFLGASLDANHESYFFMQLNRWMLATAGARWDSPGNFGYVAGDPALRLLTARYLALSLDAPRVARYLGRPLYRRWRTPRALPNPWGWKDPRTTFTLPVWLDLFPEARLVHVYRHGVDVASSLRAAQGPRAEAIAASAARFERRRPLYRFRPMRSGFALWPRAGTLEGCFSLWEEYMARARAHAAALGERAIEVCFETFLAAPERELERVARFAGLPAEEGRMAEVARRARPDRALAYRRDAELLAFAASVDERLARFDYRAAPAAG